MKINKRNPGQIIITHQTRFSAFVSLLAMLSFGSVGLRLWGNAPDQQAYLMLGLAVFMGLLLYHSLSKYTLIIDSLNQILHWKRSSPLGLRQKQFEFANIERAHVTGAASSRGRRRSRPELIYHNRSKSKIFPLIPSNLPLAFSREIVDEINAAISRSQQKQ